MTVTTGKPHADARRKVSKIESDRALDQATGEVCALLALGNALSSEQQQRLDELIPAIDAYESKYHPIPEPSHAGLLQHLMDAKSCSEATLARATGISRQVIADILRGKRQIGQEDAGAFAKYFHVGQDVFNVRAPAVVVRIVSQADVHGVLQIGWFTVRGKSTAEVRIGEWPVQLWAAPASPSGDAWSDSAR
jgi:antitoxin component HigA of HigAB toxin-antitoxin module